VPGSIRDDHGPTDRADLSRPGGDDLAGLSGFGRLLWWLSEGYAMGRNAPTELTPSVRLRIFLYLGVLIVLLAFRLFFPRDDMRRPKKTGRTRSPLPKAHDSKWTLVWAFGGVLSSDRVRLQRSSVSWSIVNGSTCIQVAARTRMWSSRPAPQSTRRGANDQG
jgi:hypothetical protein